MKLRQARKIRRNFYRTYRVMEAWGAYRWNRDQRPVFHRATVAFRAAVAAQGGVFHKLLSLASTQVEPSPALEISPLLRGLRRWPRCPTAPRVIAALRRLPSAERVSWSVDIAIYNAIVRIEQDARKPQTWTSVRDGLFVRTAVLREVAHRAADWVQEARS